MAKLSEEVLDEGRDLVRAKDLEGFKVWCGKHAYTVPWAVLEKDFSMLLRHDQVDMAVRLFDKFFPKVDPTSDVALGLMKLGCIGFVALGVIGGVLYLVKNIF